MPNFTIRRRRKKVEEKPAPVETQEEKHDSAEEYMSESSDEVAIDEAMRDLKVTPLDRTPKRPQSRRSEPPPAPRQQYNRPHYQKPATVDRKVPNRATYLNPEPTRAHIPDQYQRKPTMAIQNPRSKTRRGGSRLRFSSHYGTGGEHLDTRTKSIMLYNHCFG